MNDSICHSDSIQIKGSEPAQEFSMDSEKFGKLQGEHP